MTVPASGPILLIGATEWEPGRRHVDTQVKGLFHLWEHAHAFDERDDGTRGRRSTLAPAGSGG
jgi:ligand-binding SRPBCC domain-containing protein